MAEHFHTPQYYLAEPQDIQALANKLMQFCQTLSPIEQSLLMERIKRSMPNSEVQQGIPLTPSPEVFGAWLNAIVPDGSRWYS